MRHARGIDTVALGAATGRVLLASLFLLGGASKLASYAATAARMEEAGLPFASVLLPAVIALELGGGAALAVGRRFAAPAALALAAFTLATNAVFHRFWTLEGPVRALEPSLFFKNVSLAGGLVFAATALASARAPNPTGDPR